MRKILTKKHKLFFIFFLIVVLLSLISFNYALGFHFWLDDWMNLWFVLNGHKEGYQGQFDIHPGNYVTFFSQVYLFGTEPLLYNWFGLVCKICLSFIVGLLAWVITKNKKSFYIGTLLYASYFGGMESFVFTTARNNLLNLGLVCFTIIFYLTGTYQNKNKLKGVGLLFLFLSFLSDPARMVFLPMLLIVYEVVIWMRKRDESFSKALIRTSILIVVSLAGFFSTPLGTNLGGQTSSGHFSEIFFISSNYYAFFTGLGDLIASYLHIFKPQPVAYSWIIGVLFIIWLIAWSLWQLFKNENIEVAIFLNSIWMSLIINWLAFPYLIAVSQHRYQTISAAFFIVLVTMLLIKLKKKYLPVLVLIIILNVIHSIGINHDWNTVRDYKKVQKLINVEMSYIPKNSNPQLLVLEGSPRIVSEGLGWTFGGSVPYSFSRNISSIDDVPSSAPTLEQNVEIFCNILGKRPVIGTWVTQTKPMDINNVYGFQVNDFEIMENNTDQVRMRILGYSKCIQKTPGKIISPGLELDYYLVSRELYTPGKSGIFLHWSLDENKIDQLTIDYQSSETNYKISESHFPIEVRKLAESSFHHIIFSSDQITGTLMPIKVKYCKENICETILIEIVL